MIPSLSEFISTFWIAVSLIIPVGLVCRWIMPCREEAWLKFSRSVSLAASWRLCIRSGRPSTVGSSS
ncbi:hypothetical protein D3C72_2482120 [compost metagenome]